MKILLTGATGFAGGEVLRQALNDPGIAQVTVLTRRSRGIVNERLTEVIMNDFLDYSKLKLDDQAACIWCLGVSQTQVTEQEYIRITFDYAVAAASAMFTANPQMRFCFVSGRSADRGEKASALYARIKGRTERELDRLGGNSTAFRPGYIRATKQSGPRKDFARFFAPIGDLIGLFNDDFCVDCDQLARCLLDVAKHGSEERILVNSAIRSWQQRGSAG